MAPLLEQIDVSRVANPHLRALVEKICVHQSCSSYRAHQDGHEDLVHSEHSDHRDRDYGDIWFCVTNPRSE
jgi:hypothetical protein